MGQAGQTPGAFLLAGGAGFFSAECVAALARCGLHPDDFGSYEHVKKRIRAAKRKIQDSKKARRRGQPDSVPEPDAHELFLARSQAGHIRQNAIFQRTRADSCSNMPGAQGYHCALAPCAPQPGRDWREGTTSWANGDHDDTLRDNAVANTTLSAAQIHQHSLKNSEITARGAGVDVVSQRGPGPKRTRSNELDARKESAAFLDPESMGSPDSPENRTIAEEDSQKAAECIQAFTDAAFEAMRAQVMQDYGTDYETTKRRLEAEEQAALAARDAARARCDHAEGNRQAHPGNPEYSQQESEARAELNQAEQDLDEAQRANRSAPCLREQVAELQRMQEQGSPLPPMSGRVPPGPNTRRSQMPLKKKKKARRV